jgi:hypothetical protein
MSFFRTCLFALTLGAASTALVVAPNEAQASVSIAVAYDALLKDAESVGVATPVESKSVWEDGRIYTYTRVKVDQGIAGDLGTGAEGWVRTMGGVVGKIGQSVDGEAVFTQGKPSLVFLRKFNASTWHVSARAQGQYPVQLDEVSKVRKVVRSTAVGVLFPPDKVAAATGSTKVLSVGPASTQRLAGDALHDRAIDDVAREIAASWSKLHETVPGAKK